MVLAEGGDSWGSAEWGGVSGELAVGAEEAEVKELARVGGEVRIEGGEGGETGRADRA